MAFEVKKSNGQPIDFKPAEKNSTNDRQIICFNYDSLVDFSIGVKGQTLISSDSINTSSTSSKNTTSETDSDTSSSGQGRENPERLNAQIEVSVNGDYDFQIVKKDTQEPIDINVKPKMNNVYKIEFNPSPVTGYTLKANKRLVESSNAATKQRDESKLIASKEIESRGIRTNVSGR